jgi:replicative DNA helicase
MSDRSEKKMPAGTGDDVRRAEDFVVGCVMTGVNADADQVLDMIAADDFYHNGHQVVMRAAAALRANGHNVSASTMFLKLKQDGTIDDAGGASFLADCIVPTIAGVEYHARIIRESAMRRATRYALLESLRQTEEPSSSPEDTLAAIEQKLFAIGEHKEKTGGPVKLDTAIKAVCERLNEPPTEADKQFIRTGYEALDNLIGGLRPGRIYILAARPGVGKSALALKIALNASANGHNSLFFSLEMGAEEIAERAMAMKSSVPLNRIIGNDGLEKYEYEALADINGTGGIWIDDRAELSMNKVASVTRRAVRTTKARVIVLDYLQLLTPDERRKDRHLEVAGDTKALKKLARQCNVPILVLCQLNRESESRSDNQPKLSDLRESGSIEQDADCVMLLWRDKPTPGEQGHEQNIKCSVAKQRNGPLGDFEFTYVRPCVRFENHRPGY